MRRPKLLPVSEVAILSVHHATNMKTTKYKTHIKKTKTRKQTGFILEVIQPIVELNKRMGILFFEVTGLRVVFAIVIVTDSGSQKISLQRIWSRRKQTCDGFQLNNFDL